MKRKNIKVNKTINEENIDTRWKILYIVGGISAILVAVLLLAEIIVFTIWPQPDTASGYFEMFQDNRFIGLIDFYLLEFLSYILFIPIFLGICIALRKLNKGLILLAMILAATGIAIFLSTNNPFTLLSLNNQYTAATMETQKEIYLTAGQAIINNTGQRTFGGFNTGFFLVSISGLIISVIMLRSRIFGKSIAYLGILTYAVSSFDYIRVVFMSSISLLLLIIAAASGLLLFTWLVLISRKLLSANKY